MEKTAIQQAIEIIEKKSRQQLPNAAVSSFLIAVGVLKNLLPLEKEQIIKAFRAGELNGKQDYFEEQGWAIVFDRSITEDVYFKGTFE